MFRRLSRIAVSLIACAIAFPAVGTLLPRPLLSLPASQEPVTRTVLLLHNPIHTDIAVPVDAHVLQQFGRLSSTELPIDTPNVRYLVFGWGGRSFYIETPTWADLKAVPTLKALTVDASVMHVALYGDISPAEPSVSQIHLTEAGYQSLLSFIDASFRRDETGPALISGAGYGPYDAFFEANGRFNALLGCNTWTAAALRAAGLRTGAWNPLPWSLDLSLRLYSGSATTVERVPE